MGERPSSLDPALEKFNTPALRKFSREAETGDFYEFLPFSDLRRWVSDPSIYLEILSIPAFARTSHIKTIPLMSYLGPQTRKPFWSFERIHNRISHSLVVPFVAEEIGKRNRLPLQEITNLTLAGAFHDVGTPAFGDILKQLDPKNLDEEDFWWESLGKYGQAFVTQFTTQETLDSIIKNKGVLGEILDIADRITYTMKDLYSVQWTPGSNPKLPEINEVLSKHRDIGNIYKDVRVDRKSGKVFFKNPDRLYAFLKIRALLHKYLYLHPVNQGRELLLAKAVDPLYDPINGPITPSLLRKMGDEDLILVLKDTYPEAFSLDSGFDIVNWFPKFEKFGTEEDARLREQELKKQKRVPVIGIKKIRGFDPGISYNVSSNGQIVAFSEARPEEARELQEMGESTKGIFLIYSNVSGNKPINNLLKAVLKIT